MKAAVITRHAVSNYGSLLQALATQKAIEKLGVECEIIDYVRTDESYRNVEKTLVKNKPKWNNNALKKAVYLSLRQPESVIVGKRFQKMRGSVRNLCRRYSSNEELRNAPPKADFYIAGSDQVWGPVSDGSLDLSYLLNFAKGKKLSYASSIGKGQIDESCKAALQRELKGFKRVTVREDSAVKILGKMGINAEKVLDPVFLLDREEWSDYIEETPKQKYVLVYQIHNDTRLNDYAAKLAQKKGLKLIRVSPYYHQKNRAGSLKHPNIGEFLSYIKNAELLVTDSFHGTAFAIIFNTVFVEVLPNNKTQERNRSVLSMTGLSDRILRDNNDLALADRRIDFAYANEIIKTEREKSLKLLKEMLNG